MTSPAAELNLDPAFVAAVERALAIVVPPQPWQTTLAQAVRDAVSAGATLEEITGAADFIYLAETTMHDYCPDCGYHRDLHDDGECVNPTPKCQLCYGFAIYYPTGDPADEPELCPVCQPTVN